MVALFDRAEARDFTDVYALSASYPKDLLLTRAAEQDPGFDTAVFREMLASLSRSETGTCRPRSPRSPHCVVSSQPGPPS
ncbi:hypothetical protein ACFPN7_31340 [Amycolatopsis halotolerans]|uniref:hypothetical protein n=1 Tax=Amycolatopsis halotolerans TaxID=330083 RepID=UPI003611AB5D